MTKVISTTGNGTSLFSTGFQLRRKVFKHCNVALNERYENHTLVGSLSLTSLSDGSMTQGLICFKRKPWSNWLNIYLENGHNRSGIQVTFPPKKFVVYILII
jgi:hypothetical protein